MKRPGVVWFGMNVSRSGFSEVIVTVASDVDVIEALKLARPRVLRTLCALVAIAGLLLTARWWI